MLGLWFIQQFSEITDGCFILSMFLSGIFTCTEPGAERGEGEERR